MIFISILLIAFFSMLGIALFFLYSNYTLIKKLESKHEIVYSPKVSIISACSGLPVCFHQNIESLINQNYSNFEIIFITVDKNDPAYVVLCELKQKYHDYNIKLITSGYPKSEGQKIHQQLQGIKEISKNTEVLVFVDSDSRFHSSWLKYLVNPLRNANIGITSSIPLSIPNTLNLWKYIDSSLLLIFYIFILKIRPMAWGGSMAIKKDNFLRLDLEKNWRKVVCEDIPSSVIAYRQNLKTEFVPESFLISYNNQDFFNLVIRLKRLSVILKNYSRGTWSFLFYLLIVYNVSLVLSISMPFLHNQLNMTTRIICGLGLVFVLLFANSQFLNKKIFQNCINNYSINKNLIGKTIFRIKLFMPFTLMALTLTWIYSFFSNVIKWSSVTYKLKSYKETNIVNHSNINKL